MEDTSKMLESLIEKATQYAINCFTALNVYGKHAIEIAYLTMDANGMIDLTPLTDFVEWIRIGMPMNGKIWLLGENNKILLNFIPAIG